jgi:hypothetical protein
MLFLTLLSSAAASPASLLRTSSRGEEYEFGCWKQAHVSAA